MAHQHISTLKIAVLIPDRGDRPQLLANCLRMMEGQTLKPAHIEIIGVEEESTPPPFDSAQGDTSNLQLLTSIFNITPTDQCDITLRYRTGYERLRGKGYDLIALIENDDYYAPDYLEYMAAQWEANGRPQLLGHSYTIYYNLNIRAWRWWFHTERSSAMNTCIVPDLQLTWPADNDPYADIHLWFKNDLKRTIIKPDRHYCIGMKHGIGKCGGVAHVRGDGNAGIDWMDRYTQTDPELTWLKENMDVERFKFYSSLSEDLRVG